jgi:heat shock protein HtpX
VIATTEHSPPSTRLLVAAAVLPVVVVGVIVTAVLVVLLGPLGLLAGLVVTAAVVAVRVRRLTSGVRDRVLARIGASPADGEAHARLLNLADGLSATSGVPVPDLFVLDDPAANLLLVGEQSGRSALVVTRGLLDALDRIQLEAAVARAFAELRTGSLPSASIAVDAVARPAATLGGGGPAALLVRPFGGLLVSGYRSVADPDRDLLLDRAAASLTRYPPGLVGALEAIQRVGSVIQRPDPSTAHLWLADPGAVVPGMPARPSLDLRIEALRLL